MLALPGERSQRAVAVARQVVERLRLALQEREQLVGLAESRVAAGDDLLEILAARRQADAELVQDQAEAVGIRLAHDVVDEVEVNRLAVVLDRQEDLALARLAVGDDLELRRRLGARGASLGRLALDELLAQERLRAHQAGRVLAPVLEALVRDPHDDNGLAGVVGSVFVDPFALQGHAH